MSAPITDPTPAMRKRLSRTKAKRLRRMIRRAPRAVNDGLPLWSFNAEHAAARRAMQRASRKANRA
jgi:hypothetical protein